MKAHTKMFKFNILATLISMGVGLNAWAASPAPNTPPAVSTPNPSNVKDAHPSPKVFKDPIATKDNTVAPADNPEPAQEAQVKPKSKPVTPKKVRHPANNEDNGADILDGQGVMVEDLKKTAPDEYTVVKGDTLWGISGRFLKKPWLWHKLWNMNRKEIKNPHWIYPGNVLFLTVDAQGRVHLGRSGQRLKKFQGRLSPHARVESLANEPIPTISPSEIGPFLSKPLVINPGELDDAPKIIGSLDERVILGQGDTAYVKGLPNDGNEDQVWQIYRPGRPLVLKRIDEHGDLSPVILGYEAVYLGDAKIRKQSEGVSSVEIVKARQEIMKGDRLVVAPSTAPMNYVPRAPEKEIDAEIISLPEGVAETGRNNIVTISAGSMEGLEVGHVLAIHRKGRSVLVPDEANEIKLPNERVGLLMVFRVFDNVSYALVMGSERQIQIGDLIKLP